MKGVTRWLCRNSGCLECDEATVDVLDDCDEVPCPSCDHPMQEVTACA